MMLIYIQNIETGTKRQKPRHSSTLFFPLQLDLRDLRPVVRLILVLLGGGSRSRRFVGGCTGRPVASARLGPASSASRSRSASTSTSEGASSSTTSTASGAELTRAKSTRRRIGDYDHDSGISDFLIISSCSDDIRLATYILVILESFLSICLGLKVDIGKFSLLLLDVVIRELDMSDLYVSSVARLGDAATDLVLPAGEQSLDLLFRSRDRELLQVQRSPLVRSRLDRSG